MDCIIAPIGEGVERIRLISLRLTFRFMLAFPLTFRRFCREARANSAASSLLMQKFIILNTKFIIYTTKFIILNTCHRCRP